MSSSASRMNCAALPETTPHGKNDAMSRDPNEESAPPPHAKPHETYERHHREPPRELPEEHFVAVDPLQWRPVRLGLNLVWWGSLTVLAGLTFFALFWLLNVFFLKADESVVRPARWSAAGLAVLGGFLTFAGQCFCVKAPRPAKARVFIIGSIVGMIATAALAGMVVLGVPIIPSAEEAAAQVAPAPKEGEPAKDVIAPKDDAQNKDQAATPAGETFSRAAPAWIIITRRAKAPILVAYLLGQFLFILFLKRVARFFHDEFVADNTGAYRAFLIMHTALAILLPPAALVACFTWVIMLGLEFILMIWFLILVAATRRAIV
jgi:hypothetical protein